MSCSLHHDSFYVCAGQPRSVRTTLTSSQEGITSQIFYVCTLLLSKWSVLFLYLRLSTGGAHKVMSLAVVVASVIWAVMAVILIVVPCNPAQYYTNPQECTNRVSVAVADVSTYTDYQSGQSGKQSVPWTSLRKPSSSVSLFSWCGHYK